MLDYIFLLSSLNQVRRHGALFTNVQAINGHFLSFMFTNNWLLTFVVFNSCWSRSNCPSWTWSKRIQHSKSWTRSICQVCYSKTWLFWTICGQKNSCRRSKKLQGLAVCMGGEMDIKIFVFVMYYVRTGLKYIFQCGHSRAVNLTRLQIWRTWLSRQIAVPRRCIKAKFTGSVRGGGGGEEGNIH